MVSEYQWPTLQPGEDSTAQIVISNPTGFTQRLEAGKVVGMAVEALVIQVDKEVDSFIIEVTATTDRSQIRARQKLRQEKLKQLLGEPDLPQHEKQALQAFLLENHHTFSLEDGERGETDLIQMEIDTGDSYPKKRVRRLPFVLRQ